MKLRVIAKGMPLMLLLKEGSSFCRDYREFRRQARKRTDFLFGRAYPCLDDKNKMAGTASGHYFHQDLLVARKIHLHKPAKHVDIGSRMDGFVAHVAAFREIEVLDIRDMQEKLVNITFKKLDITSRDFDLTDYCDSVSCLHSLEHFGLGRYGGEICYDGHLKGWSNILQMLTRGGKFYFSVPIGSQRVEFNAHRVFSLEYLVNLFQGAYTIDSFNYVDDSGHLVSEPALNDENIKSSFNCNYGCGIFELTKL